MIDSEIRIILWICVVSLVVDVAEQLAPSAFPGGRTPLFRRAAGISLSTQMFSLLGCVVIVLTIMSVLVSILREGCGATGIDGEIRLDASSRGGSR